MSYAVYEELFKMSYGYSKVERKKLRQIRKELLEQMTYKPQVDKAELKTKKQLEQDLKKEAKLKLKEEKRLQKLYSKKSKVQTINQSGDLAQPVTNSYNEFDINGQSQTSDYHQYHGVQDVTQVDKYKNNVFVEKTIPIVDELATTKTQDISYVKIVSKLYFLLSIILMSSLALISLGHLLYNVELFSFIQGLISYPNIETLNILLLKASVANIGLSAFMFITIYAIEEKMNFSVKSAFYIMIINFILVVLVILLLRKVLNKKPLIKKLFTKYF